MRARSKVGEYVNRRAIFCLTEQSIAGYASAARRNIAVQSPASEPAARIHSKRETSQIGLPIAHRQPPSKQPATHEILRLVWSQLAEACQTRGRDAVKCAIAKTERIENRAHSRAEFAASAQQV
jgi:hypothetical protein